MSSRHSRQDEWVGYPMWACSCGVPWPCDGTRECWSAMDRNAARRADRRERWSRA